jgi:hypothetical protein
MPRHRSPLIRPAGGYLTLPGSDHRSKILRPGSAVSAVEGSSYQVARQKGAKPGLSLRASGGCHHPLPSPPFGPRNEHPVEVPNIAGQIETSIWHVPPCPKSTHKEKSKSLLIHSDTTFSRSAVRFKGPPAIPRSEQLAATVRFLVSFMVAF